MNDITPAQSENDYHDGGIALPRRAVKTDGHHWAAAGYTSAAAIAEWTEVGVDNPTIARQWAEAGFTAESAARWIDVIDMTPDEAATCANAGMAPLDVERIRRADPRWASSQPGPDPTSPTHSISL